MSNIALLADNEQEKFDKPPIMPEEVRSICFTITKELEDQIKKLRTATNKVGFLLQYGFFKACKKFFAINQFSKEDIKYVAKLLGIALNKIDMEQYKKKILVDHQAIILNLFGYKSFDQSVIEWLSKEIKRVVQQFSEPRHIFFQVLQKLHNQQIEIPSYYRLAGLITNVYLDYENAILRTIKQNITKQQKNILEILLVTKEDEPGLLKQLKTVNQSMKPKAIQASINLFMVLKDSFLTLLPIIETLNLAPNVVSYYATWVKKAKLSQIQQFPDQNKIYLHLIAFIQHQFYIRQDTFVDILIKSVQSIKNSVIKSLNKIEQSTRTERRNAVKYLSKSNKTNRCLIDEITAIVKSPIITDSGKVQKITVLLDEHASQQSEKEKKKAEIFERSLENISKNKDFFSALESLSVKLQNRVSGIIQALVFNKDNSDQNILNAIQHFSEKKGSIDKKAPTTFLKKEEKEALIDNKNQFRPSLYKALLFIHIVDAIKSGNLNLKYSYRYLAIQDYLVDKKIGRINVMNY